MSTDLASSGSVVSNADRLDLWNDLKKLEKSIKEVESSLEHYVKTTSKFKEVSFVPTDKEWNKLMKTCTQVKNVAGKAERECVSAIEKASKFEERKRKRDHPPVGGKRFKGDVTYSVPKDRQVAARISKDKDFPEEWILARVVNYDEHKQMYEVEDEDPGDESDPEPFRKHYWLPPQRIIPLPEEGKYKEIAKSTEVLAMFPATTAFYKAIVEQPPNFKKKNNDYILKFADDDDERGETPLRKIKPKYVILRTDVASH